MYIKISYFIYSKQHNTKLHNKSLQTGMFNFWTDLYMQKDLDLGG